MIDFFRMLNSSKINHFFLKTVNQPYISSIESTPLRVIVIQK